MNLIRKLFGMEEEERGNEEPVTTITSTVTMTTTGRVNTQAEIEQEERLAKAEEEAQEKARNLQVIKSRTRVLQRKYQQ